MAYRVKFSTRSGRDLAALFRNIHAADFIPAAPERKQNGQPLRHLPYGKKPHVYRVILDVDEPHKIVNVLTIRHGAMDTLGDTDL